jgi:hypothetical protein
VNAIAISVQDLAGRLNLERHPLSSRGDCPSCGYPRAFALRSGRNGAARLFCANGCTRDTLANTVQRALGGAWTPAAASAAEDTAAARQRRQEAALRLWAGSTAVSRTLDATYLAAPGLPELAACPALRCRGDAPHPEPGWLLADRALLRKRRVAGFTDEVGPQ